MTEYLDLPSAFYSDAGIFDQETRDLERCWHYGATVHELDEPGRYVRRLVAGRELFIQNCGSGDFKAFLNRCSHRGSLLRCEPAGKGPIVCPYHGWTYGLRGEVQVIPGEEGLFAFASGEREGLRLKSFRTKVRDGMIFVCLSDEAPELTDFLETDLDELKRLLGDVTGRFDGYELRYEANWKICVQNFLDDYHIAQVHPETFGRQGLVGGGRLRYRRFGKCAESIVQIHPRELPGLERYDTLSPDRKMRDKLYYTYFVFPGFAVASVAGIFVWTLAYRSVGVRETILQVDLFRAGSGIPDHHLKAHLGFVRLIHEQDRELCAEIQRGVEQSHGSPTLGAQEERIAWFNNAYLSHRRLTESMPVRKRVRGPS